MEAVQHALGLPMEAFLAYRHLQQALNRVRKLLQEHEPHEVPCCTRIRFIEDVFAFFSILQGNLCYAIEHRRDTMTNSQDDKKAFDFDAKDPVLEHITNSSNAQLARPDKISTLFEDFMNAVEVWSQHDALRAIMIHSTEHPSDLTCLEPATFATIVDQSILHSSLLACVNKLLPGPRCFRCSRARMRDTHGLTKLLTCQYYMNDPCFFGFHQGPVRDVVRDAFQTADSPLVIPVDRIRVASIQQVKERYTSFKTQDPVLRELIEILEDGLRQPNKVFPAPSLAPLDQQPETLDNLKNVKPVEAKRQTKEVEHHPVPPSTPVMNFSASATVEEKVSLGRAMEGSRMIAEVCSPPARLSTIEKYRARGYALTSPRSPRSPREDITKRIWIIEDHAEYHEVWRVIFPLTRNDRLVTRVSWPLFYRAMQAAPLNCRVKRAADPIFVFERRNENRGKEIFECHAPHGMDWIPAGDLYRYKKDLRDTFGMDAGRIMLETGKKSAKN